MVITKTGELGADQGQLGVGAGPGVGEIRPAGKGKRRLQAGPAIESRWRVPSLVAYAAFDAVRKSTKELERYSRSGFTGAEKRGSPCSRSGFPAVLAVLQCAHVEYRPVSYTCSGTAVPWTLKGFGKEAGRLAGRVSRSDGA